MANTYTKIHIHVVFAVQQRSSLIRNSWKDNLHKYISGIINKSGHKVLAINGISDHVHILIGLRPNQSLSDLMKKVKGSSSKWINENRLVMGRFSWQEGYSAFSYGQSQVNYVIHYIQNQEEHHKRQSLKEEHEMLLKEFNIEFDDRYLFKPVDS